MKKLMLCTALIAAVMFVFYSSARPAVAAPTIVTRIVKIDTLSDKSREYVLSQMLRMQQSATRKLPLFSGEQFPGEMMAQAGGSGGTGGSNTGVPGCTADPLPTPGCGPDGATDAAIQLCQAKCQEECQEKLNAACTTFEDSFESAAVELLTCQAQNHVNYEACLSAAHGDPFLGYLCGQQLDADRKACADQCDKELNAAQLRYWGSALVALFQQEACMEACCPEER